MMPIGAGYSSQIAVQPQQHQNMLAQQPQISRHYGQTMREINRSEEQDEDEEEHEEDEDEEEEEFEDENEEQEQEELAKLRAQYLAGSHQQQAQPHLANRIATSVAPQPQPQIGQKINVQSEPKPPSIDEPRMTRAGRRKQVFENTTAMKTHRKSAEDQVEQQTKPAAVKKASPSASGIGMPKKELPQPAKPLV
jgi:hypothetical protein